MASYCCRVQRCLALCIACAGARRTGTSSEGTCRFEIPAKHRFVQKRVAVGEACRNVGLLTLPERSQRLRRRKVWLAKQILSLKLR